MPRLKHSKLVLPYIISPCHQRLDLLQESKCLESVEQEEDNIVYLRLECLEDQFGQEDLGLEYLSNHQHRSIEFGESQ